MLILMVSIAREVSDGREVQREGLGSARNMGYSRDSYGTGS